MMNECKLYKGGHNFAWATNTPVEPGRLAITVYVEINALLVIFAQAASIAPLCLSGELLDCYNCLVANCTGVSTRKSVKSIQNIEHFCAPSQPREGYPQ